MSTIHMRRWAADCCCKKIIKCSWRRRQPQQIKFYRMKCSLTVDKVSGLSLSLSICEFFFYFLFFFSAIKLRCVFAIFFFFIFIELRLRYAVCAIVCSAVIGDDRANFSVIFAARNFLLCSPLLFDDGTERREEHRRCSPSSLEWHLTGAIKHTGNESNLFSTDCDIY